MPEAIREGIFTILFISGPLVILAAGLGLAVGILQAATQVQEQTLGSAVKVIGLLIALIVFGFYMFQYVSKYTAQALQRAFQLVPSLGSYVLPRDNFLTKPKEEEQITPQAPPTELAKSSPNTSGAAKVADAVNEPDVVQTNVGSSRPKTNSTPARSPEPTRAQPLTPVTQINTPRATQQTRTPVVPAQQAPTKTQAPVTQAPQRATAAQPARTAPVVQRTPAVAQPARTTQPVVTQPVRSTPAQPVRSSISDRLNSIKNSAGDLQEAGQ